MMKITKFKENEKTKSIGTDFNWNVILGAFDIASSNENNIHTSHPILKTNNKCQILYYQKMECIFTS